MISYTEGVKEKMNELTLVIMAAGMGSRFGGLKQLTPVDDDGNFLIDYSIHDAMKAGFQKVVIIIKEENLENFKETIGKRLEHKIPVEYAFQKLEDVPDFVSIPEERVKPWGTVHAVLAARPFVTGPFAVINADDFYGYDSYRILAEFLKDEKNANSQIVVPYPFHKVDSKFGFVKRAVLFFEEDNVQKMVESNVGYEDGKVIAKPLDGSEPFEIAEDHPVSMNMFGFQKSVMEDLNQYFETFMRDHQETLEKAEALLSEFLDEYLKENKIILKYQTSKGEWLGMTYKEDLDLAKESLTRLKENGEYPEHL